MTIKEITDNKIKSEITESVLRNLPEWFGIESSIIEYCEAVKKFQFYVSYEEDELTGFIALDSNNGVTAEIHVMGLYKKFHNMGIGSALVNKAKEKLKREGFRYLMVKTLGESHPDINYENTRKFYLKSGFYPIQEIPEIWGKENPCLIMIQDI